MHDMEMALSTTYSHILWSSLLLRSWLLLLCSLIVNGANKCRVFINIHPPWKNYQSEFLPERLLNPSALTTANGPLFIRVLRLPLGVFSITLKSTLWPCFAYRFSPQYFQNLSTSLHCTPWTKSSPSPSWAQNIPHLISWNLLLLSLSLFFCSQ